MCKKQNLPLLDFAKIQINEFNNAKIQINEFNNISNINQI